MPWGPRVAETSSQQAEGDKIYLFAQYDDTSGNLTAFMPVYKNLADAAEYNTFSTTALTQTSTKTSTYPQGTTVNTAGKVVLGTNAFAGGISTGAVPEFFGIYSPTNPTDKPSTGDIIRVLRFGSTPVQISSGQASANVGDYLQGNSTDTLARVISRTANQPSKGMYIGRVAGTGNQISVGLPYTAPGFQFGFLINGFVDP